MSTLITNLLAQCMCYLALNTYNPLQTFFRYILLSTVSSFIYWPVDGSQIFQNFLERLFVIYMTFGEVSSLDKVKRGQTISICTVVKIEANL